MSACCISGCKNRHSSTSKLKFYRIPSGSRPFLANRRRLWLQAIQQVNGSTEELKRNARICGAHFKSREASMDHDSPDFVPSVFTCAAKRSPKRKVKWFYGKRKRRRHTAKSKEEEETFPPRGDSPVHHQSSVLIEEIQTLSTSSVPKEEETLTEVTETEIETKTIKSVTPPSPNESLAGFLKLDKMRPIVLLKHVYVPAGGYQCEQCDQSFSNVSQLIKHNHLHDEEKEEEEEEEISFFCEKCGKLYMSRADFTAHQCVLEPSFPCNMCDRSFTTSHNLKRHKLRHVKDGRKCRTCGVLFCQRHNHFLFLPLAETVTEYEDDSEPQNLVPENHLLVPKPEPSQTPDLGDDAQSTMVVLPIPPKPGHSSKIHKAPSPALHTKTLSELPAPVFLKPNSVPRLPPPVLRISKNPGTSSQSQPTLPSNPATFAPSLPPRHLDLPPSLKLFSPQYLTSAFLEVKRNYEYILSKPQDVRKKIVQEELPVISPCERSIKQEITAYDLEIVI